MYLPVLPPDVALRLFNSAALKAAETDPAKSRERVEQFKSISEANDFPRVPVASTSFLKLQIQYCYYR